ncbi:MAG: hypothetical protein M1833_006442 [Piccolia ochrophora]|nr:MAG: hypothetical protein M1833_006442 [Piccolia ochrophora]
MLPLCSSTVLVVCALAKTLLSAKTTKKLFTCLLSIIAISTFARLTIAASIQFDNCLDADVKDSENPTRLQFTPLVFHARFNRFDSRHNLNVTVYGDVKGQATQENLPAWDDPAWTDDNKTLGKIADLDRANNKYSTMFAKFNVLSYTPYEMVPGRFCDSVIHGHCPVAPVRPGETATAKGPQGHWVNELEYLRDDISRLPAFSVAHQLYSSYAFTTISSTLQVKTGDVSNAVLACVSANITPDLGTNITRLLAFMPLGILILVGLATAFAAVYSPWGSPDTFRWTSNYGRDADLLRLVTPGFGDCLQYIQFVVLTGGLSLSYPGYYQPVVSQVSWSSLMFNTSLVSHGNGTQSLQDGIYTTNGTYGLDRLSQLVGMSSVEDIWAGMIVWLLVIVVAVVALIQVGFVVRWSYRHLTNVQEEDLRAKNLPFTLGNVIRLVFNYFLLPLVSLSMFQFVIAARSPPSTTAIAAAVLLVLILFTIWVLRLIATVRPRSYLFDDLPTVLLYGPLYNTYSDDAAAFALIPVVLQLVRGIAIGAVQPSGIAQLVLLAICEVILVLTLHAFRPFASPTSMNAYHTFFAIVRLLTTLLCVAFVPSLGVSEAPKGWIGYVILLMHAIVLVFGFFLNAVQTTIEVGARLAGAGGEGGVGGGAARGGLVKVFGMRQLSRRVSRRTGAGRHSGVSDAEFLGAQDARKAHVDGNRARSTSGSSAILLNRHTPSDGRTSVGLDSMSALGTASGNRPGSSSAYTPTTPGAASTFSYLPGNAGNSGANRGPLAGLRSVDTADPYYRPPRQRRATMEDSSPGARSRGSWASGDWLNKRWSQVSADKGGTNDDSLDGPSLSGRGTPVPAFLTSREASDPNVNETRRSTTDYAVREVDFYYGVRGPALSTLPARRLGTGPADPTGPVASATGWFRSLFGAKTKDKGKGFEVVRSSRVPPPLQPRTLIDESDNDIEASEPGAIISGVGIALGGAEAQDHDHAEAGPSDSTSLESDDLGAQEDEDRRVSQIPALAPSLPRIDTGEAIELPSRVASKASSKASKDSATQRTPKLPRKSSKRFSGTLPIKAEEPSRLSAIRGSPPGSPSTADPGFPSAFGAQSQARLSDASSSHLPFGGGRPSEGDWQYAGGATTPNSSVTRNVQDDADAFDPGHARHSSSIFGGHDRPTSLGYVQQHRASDNVHVVTHGPHEGVNYLGSTAELVNVRSRPSLSDDGKRSGRS